MCTLLDGYVKHIIVSFLDDYKNVRRNREILNYQELKESDYQEIGRSFSKIAHLHGMTIQTCFENKNLHEYGFEIGSCLDATKAYRLTGKIFKKWKARNCGCVEMVDIGAYNSCLHFCKYCYANYDEKLVKNNNLKHNDDSSLLIGKLEDDDIIKERL